MQAAEAAQASKFLKLSNYDALSKLLRLPKHQNPSSYPILMLYASSEAAQASKIPQVIQF